MLHFENVATSRAEDDHSALKRQLRLFTDDLKTMIDNIDLLLKNQYQEYRIVIDEAKSRIPHHIRISIFRDLLVLISSFALRRILTQYHRIVNENSLSQCIKSFTTIMKLSCAHVIQKRLFDLGILLIEDVHFKWFFDRSSKVQSHQTPSPIDSLLMIQESVIARPRGRSIDVVRSVRRQAELDRTTRRNSSKFELVKAAIQHDNQNERGRGRGRERGRKRSRGRGRGGRGAKGRGRGAGGRGRGERVVGDAEAGRASGEVIDSINIQGVGLFEAFQM